MNKDQNKRIAITVIVVAVILAGIVTISRLNLSPEDRVDRIEERISEIVTEIEDLEGSDLGQEERQRRAEELLEELTELQEELQRIEPETPEATDVDVQGSSQPQGTHQLQ